MSTSVTISQDDTSAPSAPSTPEQRRAEHTANGLAVTERRVIRSEWIKLWSVRSMIIGFGFAAAVAIGFGAIFSSAGSARRGELVNPVQLSLAGLNLSRLIIGVLGVLVISAEYSSGLIRTTLATVRSRVAVLRAKVVVFGAATAGVATVAAFTAFFVGQALYTGARGSAAISDPGVLRAVIGAAVYCVGVGLLGLALGFLLRSTAGAIGVLFATLLLIPGLAGLLPWSWSETATKYLPSNAGEAFASLRQASDQLTPWTGLVVFTLWVVAMLAGAGLVLVRRDA